MGQILFENIVEIIVENIVDSENRHSRPDILDPLSIPIFSPPYSTHWSCCGFLTECLTYLIVIRSLIPGENYSCLYSPDNVDSTMSMSVEQIQQMISQHADDADKVSACVVVIISMNTPPGAPHLVPKEAGNHMPCSTHLAHKKHADLTFECDGKGKEYPAHSLILKSSGK